MDVWEVYPGLTVEEALIGVRHMDTSVNSVQVHYKDFVGVVWWRNTSASAQDMIQYYRDGLTVIQYYRDGLTVILETNVQHATTTWDGMFVQMM